MENKELVCVNCPMGCHINVEMDGKEIISIFGNRCPRGEKYARQESIEPMRILTTTIKVEDGIYRVLPVITSSEIPLAIMEDAMDELRKVCVKAPVRENQVILENLCNTGVSVIASRCMERNKEKKEM